MSSPASDTPTQTPAAATQTPAAAQSPDATAQTPATSTQTPSPTGNAGQTLGEISADEAFLIALNNADVPNQDAFNIKNERDGDNGIPIYDIEFETEYGDYDFEIAIADGRIVGADYEVDEEWLDYLGGSPVTENEAAVIAAEKVPGSDASNVTIWIESDDGRKRYEGELFLNNMKYEFEIDPQTGKIFDWNADLRD